MCNYDESSPIVTNCTFVGNFDKAIETAQKSLKLYQDSGLEKKADDLQNRLGLFRQGQPYREKL